MAEGFQKDPSLFNYDEATPEARNKGFSSLSKPRVSNLDAVDLALLTGYEGANAIDWGQTQQVARNPQNQTESSFAEGGTAGLIGHHPSRDKVNLLMGGQAAAVPMIANQLPSGWRKALLGGLLAAKVFTVHSNTKDSGTSPGIPMVKF